MESDMVRVMSWTKNELNADVEDEVNLKWKEKQTRLRTMKIANILQLKSQADCHSFSRFSYEQRVDVVSIHGMKDVMMKPRSSVRSR
jgi:hypothetical protein